MYHMWDKTLTGLGYKGISCPHHNMQTCLYGFHFLRNADLHWQRMLRWIQTLLLPYWLASEVVATKECSGACCIELPPDLQLFSEWFPIEANVKTVTLKMYTFTFGSFSGSPGWRGMSLDNLVKPWSIVGSLIAAIKSVLKHLYFDSQVHSTIPT